MLNDNLARSFIIKLCLFVCSLHFLVLYASCFEFTSFCSTQCKIGRGGNLCKCNAVHFAGKRRQSIASETLGNTHKDTNSVSIATDLELQRQVMERLYSLLSTRHDSMDTHPLLTIAEQPVDNGVQLVPNQLQGTALDSPGDELLAEGLAWMSAEVAEMLGEYAGPGGGGSNMERKQERNSSQRNTLLHRLVVHCFHVV